MLRVAAGLAVVAALASCSSTGSREPDGSAPDRPAASTPASSTPTADPAPTPTTSPTPTLPDAADGENAEACLDGTCEIRVTGPTTVPVPESFGLGPVEVTAVDEEEETVSLTAPVLRGGDFLTRACSISVFWPSANGPGRADLTCHADGEATVNQLHLEVVGIADGTAVVGFRPAD